MKIFSKQTPFKKNIVANLFGIGVQLINQIVLIPFYLKFWDKNLYSDWIVISAIGSFFAISDIGLNSVTANQFTINYAGNNLKECNSLLTNNYLVISIVSFFSIVLCIFYLFNFDIISNLGLHYLKKSEANFVFICLVINIFIGMWTTVVNSIFRAISKIHFVVILDNISRLLDGLIILVFIIFKFSLLKMVITLLIPKLLIYIIKLHYSKRYYSFKLSYKNVDFKLIKKTLAPSIAFMGFPIGNAIVYQGFTLFVNKFFGSTSVITYNTTRTLCNFMRQIINVVQQSVWPEYSIAYGKMDIPRMRLLHRMVFKYTNLLGFSISIFLLFFGPSIFNFWTQNNVVFDLGIMISFLLILNIENIWTSSSVCLMATNKHVKLGVIYVLFCILSLFCATILGKLNVNLVFIILSILIVHIPLSFYSLQYSLKLTKDNLKGILLQRNS